MTIEDHFFLAAQRWLHGEERSCVVLVCNSGATTPMGNKRRPGIEVPGCLQELPLHRLVDLSLAGVEDVAVAPSFCCDADDLIEATTRWQEQLGELAQWPILEVTPARNWTWSIALGHVPLDRRGLLGLSRRSAPPWPIHDEGAEDHARLLSSLRAAGVTPVEKPPPGLSLAVEGCTACAVCVAACPHEALTLLRDGSTTTLQHHPASCQGEQQCIALCPVDAFTIEGPLDWPTVLDGSPRTLATLEMAVCQRCRARFPADSASRWCETCRIRRSDPFGSHLPEAAIKILKARGHDQP